MEKQFRRVNANSSINSSINLNILSIRLIHTELRNFKELNKFNGYSATKTSFLFMSCLIFRIFSEKYELFCYLLTQQCWINTPIGLSKRLILKGTTSWHLFVSSFGLFCTTLRMYNWPSFRFKTIQNWSVWSTISQNIMNQGNHRLN